MEKYNYVTLFNVNYLNRGLVMYESLKAVAKDFNLYVVCFDDATYSILKKLNYEHLIPISLKEFEDEELLRIKPSRTATEYCWTCSSSVIWYCMQHYQLNKCAYLDADMYFYSDPAAIWQENEAAEVFITLHNYSPDYDQSEISGKFCVQFVGFKNKPEAMTILKEWKDNCIQWCYNRVEDGKFGDQKYLDEWPLKYKSVHVVKNLTAGLAPWNIQQFEVKEEHKVIQKNSRHIIEPVFYHFHKLRIFSHNIVSFASAYYNLDKVAQEVFYFPYAKKLLDMDLYVLAKFPEAYTISYPKAEEVKFNLLKWLRYYFYYLRQDPRNIHPRKTNEKFKTDYIYRIR